MRAPPHPLWALLVFAVAAAAGAPLSLGALPGFPREAGIGVGVLVGGASCGVLAWATTGRRTGQIVAPVAGFAAALLATAAGARLVFTGALRLVAPEGVGPLALGALALVGASLVAFGLFAAMRLREPAWHAAEGAPRRLLPRSAHGGLEAAAYASATAFAAGGLPVGGAWPRFTGDEATAYATGLPGALALDGGVLAALAVALLLVVPVRAAAYPGSVVPGIPRMVRAVSWGVQALTLAVILLVGGALVSAWQGPGLVLPLAPLAATALALYSAVRARGGVPRLTPEPATASGVGITLSCPRCDVILVVDAAERPARYACPECGERVYLLEA